MIAIPKKADSPNLAMTIWLEVKHHWHRVFALRRSLKTATLTGLVTSCILLAGCMQSKRAYLQVVDGLSKEPLASAKITTSLYNPVNPDLHRTCVREVFSGTNGIAAIKLPMCSTRGVPVGYVREGSFIVGRADPNSSVGPELLVEKAGYIGATIYRSNNDWRSEDTSLESPFVITLTRQSTEPTDPADGSRRSGSETNVAPGAP